MEGLELIQQLVGATTGLGGSAMVGLAIAFWITRPRDKPLETWQKVVLGLGIGAVVEYAVGWIDLLKASVPSLIP